MQGLETCGHPGSVGIAGQRLDERSPIFADLVRLLEREATVDLLGEPVLVCVRFDSLGCASSASNPFCLVRISSASGTVPHFRACTIFRSVPSLLVPAEATAAVATTLSRSFGNTSVRSSASSLCFMAAS